MREEKLEIEIMKAAGIEDAEIVRLAGLRKRVAAGVISEITEEHKRMMFTRFLIETNRFSEDVVENPEPEN